VRVAAVIDIGSNSMLLLTVAVAPHGSIRVLQEAIETTRLGSGLTAEARARTHAALARFAAQARGVGAEHVWAFATGWARDLPEGAAFGRELSARTGVPLEVLSGGREAMLAFAAAAAAFGTVGPVCVVDVGGRTTELALGTPAAPPASVSLDLGALSLTAAHLTSDPPEARDLRAAAAAADAILAATDIPTRAAAARASLLVGGGTATAAAALDLGLSVYDGRRVHGHELPRERLRALLARVAALPAARRAALPGLEPGRAAILPAGLVILERLAVAVGADTVRVSDHGVRHAYLRERLAAQGVAAEFEAPLPP
jgi:exopolyphosphatase/guanosine-5'-triphosphate,3'-diphosphate pyrophosphatase